MFRRFCDWWINALGHPLAFAIAFATCIVWGMLGPVFHFSNRWQLLINTATTVITFLMLFLIQSSQNRDTALIQEKLDRIIKDSTDVHEERLSWNQKEGGDTSEGPP